MTAEPKTKLAALRTARKLTREELQNLLGIKSRGYFCDIENGKAPPSLRVALLIEAWSNGEIKAEELSPRAAVLRSQVQEVAPRGRRRRVG